MSSSTKVSVIISIVALDRYYRIKPIKRMWFEREIEMMSSATAATQVRFLTSRVQEVEELGGSWRESPRRGREIALGGRYLMIEMSISSCRFLRGETY